MDIAASFNTLWPQIEMKLPRLVNIALIVLILITLAKLFWSFFDSGVDTASLTTSTVATNSVKPQPRPNYDRNIAQMHIMGKAAPSSAKKVENAPDTTLNLKLLGVLAGDKEYGYAIISSGGNKIKHYAIGDDIPGGAILHAVYPDRVILERDIRMETLRLPKATAKGFGNAPAPSVRTTPQPQTTQGPDEFESLGQFRQEVMKNPTRLTEFISATPQKNEETGEFQGYKLTPSKNPDMFYELGFQPGDVVININGIPLDQPDKGPKALQTLATADEITMVVVREGTEITLFQDLSQ